MSSKIPRMGRNNIPLESDETDSDAHSGEGQEWQELERLSLPDSVKRKQGEILMASAWTANVRQRLAEIEEVALEEFKKEKLAKLGDAVGHTDHFRWALIEVEDWGLAMKESMLPDGTPMKFSKYFLTNLKAAVVKSEAAMALAKIALKATLDVGYLGVVGNFPFELIGAPFSQLARTHADLARDLKALEKRLKMWRDIVDESDLPSAPGSSKDGIYKYVADDDSMVNPADPFFEAGKEVRETLTSEIEQTINNARTSDGKPVDGKVILDRYFNYLNQYRDNYWADVPRPAAAPNRARAPKQKNAFGKPPAPQREMTRDERREARRKAAEEEKAARYAEQLRHVRVERIRRKGRERREKQRDRQAALRQELVERIEREREESKKKRKRAEEGAKGERLGFSTHNPADAPEKNKRARTEEKPSPSPKPPAPPPTPNRPVTPPQEPSQKAGPTPPPTPGSNVQSPRKLPKWVNTIVSGE
ncbi:uncharacterized protein F4812DRAFT_392357 [Daldinia caldariorum]|uniref:uncharacterized protein n=1 Tax=Daldinia caldariorum TaxID=326644 RepID=UPI00200822EB|nr:uncharacterized protein F4812DRAFT_392357 [Daldinia caldariorum]KAI1468132.1 hypothetical protein F4812DRAFT_392357 [Daldinia caldariorum]